jgi:hypothetical protein
MYDDQRVYFDALLKFLHDAHAGQAKRA